MSTLELPIGGKPLTGDDIVTAAAVASSLGQAILNTRPAVSGSCEPKAIAWSWSEMASTMRRTWRKPT